RAAALPSSPHRPPPPAGRPPPHLLIYMRHIGIRSLALLGVVGSLAACGSDSATAPKTLSASEAQLVASNLFVEISKALSTAVISTSVAPAAETATATAPTTVKSTLNSACQAGGKITGTYTYTSDFSNSGSGTQSGSVTVVTDGCKVSSGTQTIAVSGNLSLTFSVNYTNFAPSSNYQWRETGNFSWSGGSCAIDYTITVTPQGK